MESLKSKKKEFFNAYSDQELKKLLAVEITSITDKSPTVKNIFEELKRRKLDIKINDYTDTIGIMDYLLESFSEKFTNYCLTNLTFNEELGDEYNYSCLPLCVVDAVFSIGVRYEGVKNVVQNVSKLFEIAKYTQDENKRPDKKEQISVSDFLKKTEHQTPEELANDLFKNHQRTSSSNGILKAEAVVLFLKTLQSFKIEYLQDVTTIANDMAFEKAIKNIKGQSSGIALKYFFMLSGNEDLIKPDRMILAFLFDATGKIFSHDEAQEILLETAVKLSKSLNLKISARYLDNKIWSHQRSK